MGVLQKTPKEVEGFVGWNDLTSSALNGIPSNTTCREDFVCWRDGRFQNEDIVNSSNELLSEAESLRDWVEQQAASSDQTSIAMEAINACRQFVTTSERADQCLDSIQTAALHPQFVVWNVGLYLLARLAEDDARALTKIQEMAVHRLREYRRRSIQFLSDRYPRSFVVNLLTRLLKDRAASVRDAAIGRVCSLALTEVIPELASAQGSEPDTEVRWCLAFTEQLMRDNYCEYENENGYNIAFYYPELCPAITVWPGQVTRADIDREGLDVIRDRVKTDRVDILESRHAWRWNSECAVGHHGTIGG